MARLAIKGYDVRGIEEQIDHLIARRYAHGVYA
jgi:hypothetical protein